MYELKLDRPRVSFCRKMAKKALKKCVTVFPDGWPHDLAIAASIVLPGFLVFELEKLPKDVYAIVDIEDRSIGVNHSLSLAQKRYSIAHEIGHVWMDHPSYVYEVQGRQDAILESEANIFAAEFLVPKNALKREFFRCRNYEILAEKFYVDRQIMYYRFKDTGLLRQIL